MHIYDGFYNITPQLDSITQLLLQNPEKARNVKQKASDHKQQKIIKITILSMQTMPCFSL